MIINVIGLSAGPYLAGFLSDLLAPTFGIRSLGVSLNILNLTYVIGVVHFVLASRTVDADVLEAEGRQSPPMKE